MRTGDTVPVAAVFPNHVWTYDFMFDATHQGRRVKVLAVIDEFTREALAVVPARSPTAASVKGVLAKLFAERGRPERIRSDNGPGSIAFELTEWLGAPGAATHHIEPGKPWQNSFAESFNSRVRDECQNMHRVSCSKRGGSSSTPSIRAVRWDTSRRTSSPHPGAAP